MPLRLGLEDPPSTRLMRIVEYAFMDADVVGQERYKRPSRPEFSVLTAMLRSLGVLDCHTFEIQDDNLEIRRL